MITDKKIDDAMRDFTAQAKNVYGDKLQEVILFGSCARGDYDDESDVDIMILLDVPEENIRQERDRLDPVIWNLDQKYEYDLLFSPIVKSKDSYEYWIQALPFYQTVQNEGVRYA